jgi:hypothetical protein
MTSNALHDERFPAIFLESKKLLNGFWKRFSLPCRGVRRFMDAGRRAISALRRIGRMRNWPERGEGGGFIR